MARNQQSGNGQSWNDSNRFSQSEDRIMRRGDDRTVGGSWNSQSGMNSQNERNSYRTDDYPTDKEMYRAGDDRYDRDMAYGHYGSRNNQQHGQTNYTTGAPQTFNSNRDYGWSPDYRSSNDYRSMNDSRSQDQSYGSSRDSSWQTGGGMDRSYGRQDNMYGQGGDLSNSQRSYGMGSSNFGSATSDSLRGGSFGSSGYGSSYGSGSYGSSGYGSEFRSGGTDNRSGTQYGGGFGSTSSSSMSYGHTGKGPKNYKRSDDRIKEDVSDALERNPQIDASEIEVDVKEGVVTLRGHVEDRKTKRLAEDVLESMTGVKDIRNELTVDQSIFTQARNALFGESVDQQSASSTNANKSTATKSKH